MAIRFIDTSFFKSPFVRGLKGASKTLYCFIICDCNGAGIWSKDLEIASTFIGQKYTEADFVTDFINKGKAIDLENGRFFFPDFIDHQYPKGLQANNPAHKNFIAELLKYSLLDESLKPLRRPFEGSKVIVTVTDTVTETVKVKVGNQKKIDPPTPEEVQVFIQSEGYPLELAVKVYNYYNDADWHDSKGNKVKNWKQKIRGNWLKPENKNYGKQGTSNNRENKFDRDEMEAGLLKYFAPKPREGNDTDSGS